MLSDRSVRSQFPISLVLEQTKGILGLVLIIWINSTFLQNATATVSSFNVSDVVTVLVAVISSLGAVTLSAFLSDFFRERRGRKRAKSLVVACLDSVYIQMPEIESDFRSLSKNVWGEDNLPAVFSLSKNLSTIDTSLFDKVRENLLELDVELANAMVSYELYLRRINREAKGWIEILSEEYLGKGTLNRAEIVNYLRRNSKFFGEEAELIKALANVTVDLRRQLFQGRKTVKVDWDPVSKKSQDSLAALAETMPTYLRSDDSQ